MTHKAWSFGNINLVIIRGPAGTTDAYVLIGGHVLMCIINIFTLSFSLSQGPPGPPGPPGLPGRIIGLNGVSKNISSSIIVIGQLIRQLHYLKNRN